MIENTAFDDEVVNHFPTSFMRRRHRQTDDLNKRLRRFLLELEKRERNKVTGTSNLDDFHSDTKLLSAKDDGIVELRQMITEGIFSYLGVGR